MVGRIERLNVVYSVWKEGLGRCGTFWEVLWLGTIRVIGR